MVTESVTKFEAFQDLLRQLFPLLFYTLFGFRQILDEILTAWNKMWVEIWDAIKHLSVYAAIDAVLRFTSQMPGILGSAPFYGMKRWFLDRARDAKIHNSVITLEGAIEGFSNAQIEFFQTFSGTNEQGITDIIAQAMGRLLWHTVKRFKLLLTLLKAETEAEVIALMLRSLRGGAVLGLVLIFIQVARFIFGFIGCTLAMWGMIWHFEKIAEQALQQRTKRKKFLLETTAGKPAGRIRRRVPGGNPP